MDDEQRLLGNQLFCRGGPAVWRIPLKKEMAGYPSAEEKRVLDATETLMRETMARYDPSHDAYHVQRVRKTALALARAHADADLLVVELAALLHDVLDEKYAPAPDVVADPYARFFRPFFERVAAGSGGGPRAGVVPLDLVADGRARLVARVVANVSWTAEQRLLRQRLLRQRRGVGDATLAEEAEWLETCVELHCVQDADRLDAIGAFGIMRCAAYSAVINQPLYIPQADDADFASKSMPSAIQHFHDKLLKIKDRLKTEAGRRLGEQRHQTIHRFLAAVEQEYNVDVTLGEV